MQLLSKLKLLITNQYFAIVFMFLSVAGEMSQGNLAAFCNGVTNGNNNYFLQTSIASD